MEPAPPPDRPGSALGLYLRTLGRGLGGLVWRAAPAAPPAHMGAASAVAAASPRLARAQRVLGALALLLAGICVWVVLGDGVAFDVAGQEVSLRSMRNPSKLLFLFGGGWYVLRDLRRGRWDAPHALALVGRLRPATRAGLIGWGVLLYGLTSTVDRVGECIDVQAGRAATGNGSSLFINEWHLHLQPLIAHVAAREAEPEVALYIEDINPRGHLDSFYAYPRLLRMEPGLHAWSLAEMMCRGGEEDPGFQRPERAPGLEVTLQWAATRGLAVLVSRPEGVDVVAAGERR